LGWLAAVAASTPALVVAADVAVADTSTPATADPLVESVPVVLSGVVGAVVCTPRGGALLVSLVSLVGVAGNCVCRSFAAGLVA